MIDQYENQPWELFATHLGGVIQIPTKELGSHKWLADNDA